MPKGKATVKRLVSAKWVKSFVKILNPLISRVGMKTVKNRDLYNKDQPTIVVVTHEASITGAPILALNICKDLSATNNIIVIILRNGKLNKHFEGVSIKTIRPRLGITTRGMLERVAKKLNRSKPKYAIINSVVSANAIKPIRKSGTPVITLVHEFSAYIRPIGIMNEIGIWSDKIVFSSPITKEDIERSCPQLKNTKSEVLPQGKCDKPDDDTKKDKVDGNKDEAWRLIEQIDEETILIIGAGEVQPRKGIDLFIATASKILKNNKSKKIRFLWIGSGYDPINDFNISLWLKDQIYRSGLERELTIVGNSSAYNKILKKAKFLLMTSRLDPLPNVAIDALFMSTPVHCFENACGIANIYKDNQILYKHLVAPYWEIDKMAKQVSVLINDDQKYKRLSNICQIEAKSIFCRARYINKLSEMGDTAYIDNKKFEEDMEYLLKSRMNQGFASNDRRYFHKSNNIDEYLLRWRNGIWPRRPEPNFHPGIYREITMIKNRSEDGYVDYLKKGRPNGKWKTKLIKPSEKYASNLHEKRCALHIHIHYLELLDEIIKSLQNNTIKPDIYITHNRYTKKDIETTLRTRGMKAIEIEHVPNRGRDIGPLLTVFGKYLDKNYEYYGHVHTKKSIHIDTNDAYRWRSFLLTNLLGNDKNRMADNIISRMMKNENIGLVFPSDPYCVGWNENKKVGVKLAERMGIDKDLIYDNINFPVGTMFWTKSGALSSLYELNLDWTDYPEEPIDYDGTILHAIERLVPIIVESKGLSYEMTYTPNHTR